MTDEPRMSDEERLKNISGILSHGLKPILADWAFLLSQFEKARTAEKEWKAAWHALDEDARKLHKENAKLKENHPKLGEIAAGQVIEINKLKVRLEELEDELSDAKSAFDIGSEIRFNAMRYSK